MKVYAVWSGAYEQAGIDEMFATRELAEAYIEKDTASLRRRWDRLVKKAGTVKEGSWIQQKQPDGSFVKLTKFHRPPPSWEDYLRMHDKPWIEEYEVHED